MTYAKEWPYYSKKNEQIYIMTLAASTRRPGEIPWRSPEGPNIRDLQETFRGLLEDQKKKIDNLMKKVFFRRNSSCFTHLLLFFTGKTIIQKF